MSVVFLGCLQESQDTLVEVVHRGVIPDHVVGLAHDEALRSHITNYADLAGTGRALGIDSSEVETYRLTSQSDVDLMKGLRPSVLLVVGWQRLVPPQILELIEIAALGFHGSANILPWGRGRSPINWSIIEGRDRFVLHMFVLRPGVDDGDVVGLRAYDINEWDSCRSVYYKTAIAQAELIQCHLPSILDKGVVALPQQGEAVYYPKRSPQDGLIDWSADAEEICRLVRAVTRPYPGAFSIFEGTEIRIWEAQPFSRDLFADQTAGRVCFISQGKDFEFAVACGDGSVLITRADLAGRAISVGDVLG